MGPEQLAGVMETVHRNSAKAQGRNVSEEELRCKVDEFRSNVQRDSECYQTSAAVIDDGIIDPRDTRDVLGMCLEVVRIPGIHGSPSHTALARM